MQHTGIQIINDNNLLFLTYQATEIVMVVQNSEAGKKEYSCLET